ncbi:MAG TPA: DUF4396 domain-containing protein [Usitatibacter sp.]|jgi:hypothetical protein|nr:DUF4396 domain-containing protein [Usitatibacter sp.]
MANATTLAWIGIGLGVASFLVIAAHLALGHRQRMAVMNAVWPVTGLYAGPIAVATYFAEFRRDHRRRNPWRDSALAATHCGAGCCLGDIGAEAWMHAKPFTLLGSALAASWTLDFAFAFVLGIAFQYASIKPMSKLPAARALLAALKADSLSLVAWQAGMYGAMAFAMFGLAGRRLEPAEPVFWLAMQGAMIAGFLVSWPVNALLLRAGIKERM